MKTGNGVSANKFRATVPVVARITVKSDDAAKEGIVHAMHPLNGNHAAAARWFSPTRKSPPLQPAHAHAA